VNCLMASPLAKGLFHRAIAESGQWYCQLYQNNTLSSAEKEGINGRHQK
jgi:carboxylesterase type B